VKEILATTAQVCRLELHSTKDGMPRSTKQRKYRFCIGRSVKKKFSVSCGVCTLWDCAY